MFRLLFFFVSSCLAFACSSCKDKNCPNLLFYQLPYTLTPAKDTFNLGDTLWIEMDFPEEMTDVNGGIKNVFQNYNFRIELACDKMDIDPPMAKTTDYLRFHKVIGQNAVVNLPGAGVSGYKIFPIFQNGRYHFKCGLITQKKGLFAFGVTPVDPDENGNDFRINGQCDHTSLSIGTKLVGTEGNFHLLQYGLNPVYPSYPKDRFEMFGGYCFVVK